MPRGKAKSEDRTSPKESALSKGKYKLSADLPPSEYRQLLKLKNNVATRSLERENWDVNIGIGVIVRAALVNLNGKTPDEILKIVDNLQEE